MAKQHATLVNYRFASHQGAEAGKTLSVNPDAVESVYKVPKTDWFKLTMRTGEVFYVTTRYGSTFQVIGESEEQ